MSLAIGTLAMIASSPSRSSALTTRAARSVEVARVHVALGEADDALSALATACDAREGSLRYIKSDPYWDPIAQRDARGPIIQRLGLA